MFWTDDILTEIMGGVDETNPVCPTEDGPVFDAAVLDVKTVVLVTKFMARMVFSLRQAYRRYSPMSSNIAALVPNIVNKSNGSWFEERCDLGYSH